MSKENPEIGLEIDAGGINTNYHDAGQGSGTPLLLLHGSGPGVTAWANWRLNIQVLAQVRRVVAPDMVGFGYTERPKGIQYNLDTWVKHGIDFLDALGIEQADVVGNSYGGALALAMAIRYPHRVRRLVLMGAAGVQFELTPGLDEVWGYTPSVEGMRRLMDSFAYDKALISNELAELRYGASIRPGYQEAFSQMFPAPRQRWVDALASPEADIRAIDKETLILHGREDRIVPPVTSKRLFELIERAQLHMFGRCGHWTQIEHAARFNELVNDFLSE
ncbi:alpha/beta fold hydrolase [Pseudomonas sp. SST3]|jgi:2-hydroxymuconate-semialdehyde hydrolase|uniref:alpha/beta fold hydrolase n=1 Tax=Pseudomonas sp. SST3 TaxID=2267882 RepID=UPI000DFD930A|nr:alpha/beta fold hydrolase [Pseudomonas sp. SST3]NKQ12836.1 alpha/beta fold hydrolase [Pseudomonas sp. SST3]